MPTILDFSHFNIYSSFNEGEFSLLENTSINSFVDTLLTSGNYKFYVATVDNADQESEPSDTLNHTCTAIEWNNWIKSGSPRLQGKK